MNGAHQMKRGPGRPPTFRAEVLEAIHMGYDQTDSIAQYLFVPRSNLSGPLLRLIKLGHATRQTVAPRWGTRRPYRYTATPKGIKWLEATDGE